MKTSKILLLAPLLALAAMGRAQHLTLFAPPYNTFTLYSGPYNAVMGDIGAVSYPVSVYTDLAAKVAQYAPQYEFTYDYDMSGDFEGGVLFEPRYTGPIVQGTLSLKPGQTASSVAILIPHVEFGLDQYINGVRTPYNRGIYRDFTIAPAVQAVPEPATLLALAPALLVLRKRRAKKAASVA